MKEILTPATLLIALILLWVFFEPKLQAEERKADKMIQAGESNPFRASYWLTGCTGLFFLLVIIGAGLAAWLVGMR